MTTKHPSESSGTLIVPGFLVSAPELEVAVQATQGPTTPDAHPTNILTLKEWDDVLLKPEKHLDLLEKLSHTHKAEILSLAPYLLLLRAALLVDVIVRDKPKLVIAHSQGAMYALLAAQMLHILGIELPNFNLVAPVGFHEKRTLHYAHAFLQEVRKRLTTRIAEPDCTDRNGLWIVIAKCTAHIRRLSAVLLELKLIMEYDGLAALHLTAANETEQGAEALRRKVRLIFLGDDALARPGSTILQQLTASGIEHTTHPGLSHSPGWGTLLNIGNTTT